MEVFARQALSIASQENSNLFTIIAQEKLEALRKAAKLERLLH